MPMPRRVLLGALTLPTAAAADGFSPAQRAEIVAILRDALRTDPSILAEAQAAAAATATAARDEAARARIAGQTDALFGNAEDAVLGNPRGSLALVEFADPRCGFCKQLHPVRQELLRRQPDLRVVMKDLAVLGPASVFAARALLAAQRQGRYAALHDALYRLREEPTESVIRREAERIGIDWPRLRREVEDPAIGRRLDTNLRLAQTLQIEGTPAVVVGRTLIAGAVDLATLERAVETARLG